MRRLMALPVTLVALLALVVAGCGGGSSSSSESTGATEGNTPENAEATNEESAEGGEESTANTSGSGKSVFFLAPVASPSMTQVNVGFERGAEELGWSESELNSELSPDKQISNMEVAINKGAAAVGSWTLDPNTVAGAYEQAAKKNIPVIGLNSEGPGVTASVYWENQRCEPGNPWKITAEKIAELHPGAKTIMMGMELAESTKELSDCFKQEAEKAGLDIINNTSDEENTSAAGAQKVVEPLLTKYPDVEAIWCFADTTALGVSAALQASGKTIATTENPEGVILTGLNGEPDAIEAVEDGRLSWTWDPDNVATGFAAIKLMNEALEGGTPESVMVKAEMVDSESVGKYVPSDEREYTLENLPLVPLK